MTTSPPPTLPKKKQYVDKKNKKPKGHQGIAKKRSASAYVNLL